MRQLSCISYGRTLLLILTLLMTAAVPAGAVNEKGEFVLVIDPGHGGKDPGAVNGKNQEKTINP